MVELTPRLPMLHVEVQGWHQLWALRRRLRLPLATVQEVRHDPEAARGLWKGWRLPGTHVPGLIVAGSYYQQGRWTFFDVVRSQNTVVVELRGANYDRLVVEVADPEATVERLRRAL